MTNHLAYARREFRRIALERLREMTGSEEEFRREARALLGVEPRMNWLSDEAIARLQTASALPDLSGTRYSLIGRVGSGGMGTVYLATDSILGRRVALKVLDLADAQGELGARLLREAHILARFEHPGIVPGS